MPNDNNEECLEKIVDIEGLKVKCLINIDIISNEDFDLIKGGIKSLDTYIYEYQQNNKNNNYALNHYTNDIFNFSMTLFKYSECSLLLAEKGKKQISTDNIIVNLNNYLDSNNVYIQLFIEFNNKISYSLYDSMTMEKINIKEKCLNCKYYKIVNNYTNSISKYIGNSIISLIQNEQIDLFNEQEDIFNDVCYNLTINNIDYPLNIRKSKFYLGNANNLDDTNMNIILCGDPKCMLIKDFKENSTSTCSCPIDDNSDINDIFTKGNKVILNSDKISIYKKNDTNESYISLEVIKCFQNSFNKKKIKNNFGFSFSIIAIGAEIICYLSYIIFQFYKSTKLSKVNAPPKRNNKENTAEDEEKKEKSDNIQQFEMKDNNISETNSHSEQRLKVKKSDENKKKKKN
jgi:hypothetical protein